MMLCAACISWKRLCFIHCLFSIIITLAFVFYTALGIALIYLSAYTSKGIEKLCKGDGSNSQFQDALNELYSAADQIFCVDPLMGGCSCYLSHTPEGGQRDGFTYYSLFPEVYKVQECTEHLMDAYSDYGVSFDDISGIVQYLDYFGDIEKAYDCAGICDYQSVYYFSNSDAGAPKKACYKSIKNKVILGEILGMGIAYLITGLVLGTIGFVQYGLCCRKADKKNKKDKDHKHHDESKEHSLAPSSRQNVYIVTVPTKQYYEKPAIPPHAVEGAQGYL